MTAQPPQPEILTSLGVVYTVCPECECAYSGRACPLCEEQKYEFYWDQLDEINRVLEECGAVMVIGGHACIDQSRVPRPSSCGRHTLIDLLSIYKGLIQFGYANGLLREYGYTSEAA